MLRTTFSAIFAFLLFLVLHVLDFHFLIPTERTHHLLITAFIGLTAFPIIGYLLPNEDVLQKKLCLNEQKMRRYVYPLLGCLFYGFLFLGYLEFYFTAERSITCRMLMIIDKQPSHTVTPEHMLDLYDTQGIIYKRLDDLTYGGYLSHQGNNYQLTTKGSVLLKVYRFTIDYLHLGDGERKSLESPHHGSLQTLRDHRLAMGTT